MPTELEEKDLAIARSKVQEIKGDCYDRMRHLINMSAEELKHSGHASIGAALEWTFKHTDRQVNKIWEDHLRKYPDK